MKPENGCLDEFMCVLVACVLLLARSQDVVTTSNVNISGFFEALLFGKFPSDVYLPVYILILAIFSPERAEGTLEE